MSFQLSAFSSQTTQEKTLQTVAGAAVIVAAFLTFPFEALPFGAPGIDSGWQWVVNVAADNGWAFGRDVVFTYGPLGWLATPMDVGHHVAAANGFRIALQGLVFLSALMFLFRFKHPVSTLVFSALWTFAGATGLRFEGFVILAVAVLMMASLRMQKSWPAAAAGVITGIVPFVKTSLGIAAAATFVVGLAFIRQRRGPRAPILPLGLSGATALMFAIVLFPSVAVFFSWIGQALEVVGGYAAAASIIGPQLALGAGTAMLLAVAAGGTFLSLRVPTFRSTALILAPGLLISFRLAFVRQDGHQFLFVPFVVALLGVAALGASRRLALGLLLGGGAALGIGSLTGMLPYGPAGLTRVVTLGHRGPSNLAQFLQPNQCKKSLAEASRRNLKALELPDHWTAYLRSGPNGMTVVPWELMYAPANNLPFQPLRSMQLYSAYTPTLDRLTADSLSGPGAPDFVLDDFAPVGKRRALLDAPRTWRSLFLNYRLHRLAEDNDLLLLTRRTQPLEHRWEDLGAASLQVGGPGIAVPSSPHMVFAEIDAPLNLFGRLNKAFFRVPLLLAVFHRIDGDSSWARLIPATAPAGILVSHFPNDIDDYAGLWVGRGPVAVSRFQIAGPGKKNYTRSFDIRWRAIVLGQNSGNDGPGRMSDSRRETPPDQVESSTLLRPQPSS